MATYHSASARAGRGGPLRDWAPVGERRGERRRLVLADGRVERAEHSSPHPIEHILMEVVALALKVRLHGDVPLRERPPVRPRPEMRQQGVGDAALPVDERAVAVEGDPLDVRHGYARLCAGRMPSGAAEGSMWR